MKNLALFMLLTSVLALFFARAIEPATDTFWHLSIGRLITETKQIPSSDPFVFVSSHTPFVSTEWLAGLTYYFLVQNFGPNSLVVLRIVMALLILGLVYLSLKFIVQSRLLRVNLSLLIGYILALRFFDRPENFSFLFLSFINYLGLDFYHRRRINPLIILCPVVFLAWPNLHGFGPLGVALIAFYCMLLLIKSDFKIDRNLKIFMTFSVVSILLSITQVKRFFYFLEHLKDYAIPEYSSLWQRLWQSQGQDFFNQISGHIYLYLAVFMLTIISLFHYLKADRKNYLQILVLTFILVSLSLGLKLSRMIPPLLLMTIPLLFLAIPLKSDRQQWLKFLNGGVLILLLSILLISSHQEHILGSREDIQLFKTGDSVQIINTLYYPQFPQSVPRIINNHLSSKHLFTSMHWSNYLLWHSPQIKVFGDAIWHYRRDQDIKDQIKLRSGQDNWQHLLVKYDIDTVVNSPEFDFQPNHTPVYKLKGWKLVYIDEQAIIYAREDVIRSLPVDLWAINPYIPSSLKIRPLYEAQAIQQLTKLLEFDPRNAFARDQLIQYYLQTEPLKARTLAEESRELLPKNPIFSAHLANIYLAFDCPEAQKFAQEARDKSFNHPRVKSRLQSSNRCMI